MDLTPRKKIILSEIVKAHITFGEPVSSKLLCELTGLGLSSATIRNEMSDLTQMGYLEQPHTSAGRVPTAAGYRMYVTGLLDTATLSEPMQNSIDKVISKVSGNPENMTAVASEAFSKLIGFPTLSMTIPDSGAYVKRVELMPMGKRSALLVLVTSDGVARSRICRSGENLSRGSIEVFDRLVATCVVGCELDRFSGGYLQNLAVKTGEYALCLVPIISVLFEMIENVCHSQLDLKGETNVYSFYKKESDARKLVEFMSRRDAIISILSSVSDPVSVIFGEDYGEKASGSSSIVVAQFGGGNNRVGKIGVIGPTRMAYEDIIPSITYFANELGKILEQSAKDLD